MHSKLRDLVKILPPICNIEFRWLKEDFKVNTYVIWGGKNDLSVELSGVGSIYDPVGLLINRKTWIDN